MSQTTNSRPGQVQTGAAVGALAGGSQAYDSTRAQELQRLAEKYHRLGLNLIPIGDDKRPVLTPTGRLAWDKWQDARQTAEDLAGLPWGKASGLAAVCGPVSGALVCVDFDPHEKDNPHAPAPSSRLVQATLASLGLTSDYGWLCRSGSGRGYHIWLRCPGLVLPDGKGKLDRPARADFDHIELRYAGHYVLLPGSAGNYGFMAGDLPQGGPAVVTPADLLAAYDLVTATERAPSKTARDEAPKPATHDGRYSAYAQTALDDELDELARAREGTRNDRLNAAAYSLGQLVGAGLLDRADVESQLEATALAIGLAEHETRATVKSGLDSGQKAPRQVAQSQPKRAEPRQTAHEAGAGSPGSNGTDPATQDGARRFAHTDMGNAERLTAYHGQDLRYCPEWARWLVWTGQRWEVDRRGLVNQQAKRAVRRIYSEAAGIEDEERRKDIAKWALRSEAKTRVDAMLGLAQSETGIPVTVDELDANPWLLTVSNGTIDLRTGVLRAHSRRDLGTKLAPVAYDPDARCPVWLAFLETVMAGRQDLIEFLRRAIGYSLTGDVSEQVVFFAYGLGANGKTTLAETITAMLGDYAQKAPRGMLTMRAGAADGVPNDIARLPGARFVVSNEVEEGRRLAEAQVKDLAGGDTLTARFMRGEFFEFRPTHKLWIYGNHKPVIRGTDEGIWRRMRLIPFEVTIPGDKQDRKLAQKLRAELPGILAWAVQGCLDWQKDGLSAPAEVTEATAAYRAEMDVLADFLNDKCHLAPSAAVSKAALFTAYQTWCEVNRERPLGKIAFGARLKERGIADGTIGRDKTRAWLGVGLLTTPGGENADNRADNADNRGHDFQYSTSKSDSHSVIPENASALSALSARNEPDEGLFDFDEGEL